MFEIVLRQTIIMFGYMMVGFILFKFGKITSEGSKSLANLLIYFIFPVVIIKSFRREFSLALFKDFSIGFGFCILSMVLSIVVSRFVFRKNPINSFAAAFPNAGFFGVPLLAAVLGEQAVIYSIGTSFVTGTLQHTYGVGLLTGERGHFTPKTVLFAPNCVATILGIICFTTGISMKFPPMLNTFIDGISALNGPVVMLILGSYLAQSDLSLLFKRKSAYFVSTVRLLVIPFMLVLLLSPFKVDSKIKFAVATCIATPCGANVAVYCHLHGKDYKYGCQLVALSTLIGTFTIPVMCAFAQKIFGAVL